jgi:hypothetical protein
MWTCEKCKRGFQRVGQTHSCKSVSVEDHLKNKELAKELPKNIKTFAVHPGSVKTDMNKNGDQAPYDQAKSIIEITKNWKEEFNGKFMCYSGEEYPL